MVVVGVAVEARQRGREEVGGTDHGDVDVRARWASVVELPV